MRTDEENIWSFPFIRSINDVIDKDILDILLFGFSERIKQVMIFVPVVDPSDTIPEESELTDFSCDGCALYMENKDCQKIRVKEVEKYDTIKEDVTFYFCENGDGAIHLEYAIIIDGKFLGLLVGGTARFQRKYSDEEMKSVFEKLNGDYKKYATEIVTNYDIRWFEKDNKKGFKLNKELFEQKVNDFSNCGKKIIKLLNQKYTGKIRESNRNAIRDFLELLYSEQFNRKDENSEDVYIVSCDAIIFFLKKIFPIKDLMIYDNFFVDRGENQFTLTSCIKEHAEKELRLSQEHLAYYTNNREPFFWESKNQFIKKNFSEVDKVKRRRFYEEICMQINYMPSYLILLPINILRNNKAKVLIIFVGEENGYVYESMALRYHFLELSGVFRFVFRNFYERIVNERYLQTLSHDTKSIASVLYTKMEDMISDLNRLSKIEIEKKLTDILKASDNVIEIADNIINVSKTREDGVIGYPTPHKKAKINFYKEVYSPLFHNYKPFLEKKELYFDDDKIAEQPEIFTYFHLLYRVIENIFTNIIKYSIPHTRVMIRYDDIGGKNIRISFSNVTYKIWSEEFNKIKNEYYRANNTIKLLNTYKSLGLPKGKGLGLKIIKDLINRMGSEYNVYASGLNTKDHEALKDSDCLCNYDVNELMRFNSVIQVEKYLGG